MFRHALGAGSVAIAFLAILFSASRVRSQDVPPPGKNQPAAPRVTVDRKLQTTPEVSAVVAKAGAYLKAYEDELSSLVAEEKYTQRQYRPKQKISDSLANVSTVEWVPDVQRQLKSDFLLVKAPGGSRWTPFRDVYEVDGAKVRDRDERLRKLFLEQPRVAGDRAAQITSDSARYNIGFVDRNINVPTFALMFVDPANRDGFTFTKVGESTFDGVNVWRVGYHEWKSPTIVHGATGDLPAEGELWIDPVQGRIVKTIMRLHLDQQATEEVTVTYARTPRTGGTWVPAEMLEVYRGKTRQLECLATYSNIRRFEVSTDVKIK